MSQIKMMLTRPVDKWPFWWILVAKDGRYLVSPLILCPVSPYFSSDRPIFLSFGVITKNAFFLVWELGMITKNAFYLLAWSRTVLLEGSFGMSVLFCITGAKVSRELPLSFCVTRKKARGIIQGVFWYDHFILYLVLLLLLKNKWSCVLTPLFSWSGDTTLPLFSWSVV